MIINSFMILIMLTISASAFGSVLRVPQNFPNIQGAIFFAEDADTVLVSDGIYTGNKNRNIDFMGKSITVLSLNGPAETVIDCEYRGRGFYFGSGEDETAILKGFTIRRGRDDIGGGIFCTNSSPTISNCIITGNKASSGAGIYCNSSFPEISGTTISGNKAYFGGGLWCYYSIPVLTNCILWADTRDEIYATLGTPVVAYSNIQGGFAGEGNIDADPLFKDPENDDFHLMPGSPCIDSGTLVNSGKDLDGQPRPYPSGGEMDMGVDERWPQFDLQIKVRPAVVTRGEIFLIGYTMFNPEIWDVPLNSWIDAYLPNGKPSPGNPLKGPISFYLWSLQPFEGVVSATVDEAAPVGTYKIYLEAASMFEGISLGSAFDSLQVVY